MTFLERLRDRLQRLKKNSLISKELAGFHDQFMDVANEIYKAQHSNSFVRFARYGFSQSDEDGLTLEIIRRISSSLKTPHFAEFGVGTGVENNTIALAALGWKGCWFGNEELEVNLPEWLTFKKTWITRENVYSLIEDWQRDNGVKQVDVVSVDLDFNDYHVVKALLENSCHAKLFIIEYNAKIPPPIEFVVPYEKNSAWDGSDYFGASLASYCQLFDSFDYFLVACNPATGANAFFVQKEFRSLFSEVPSDVDKIYCRPNYTLRRAFGHRRSGRTIEHLLNQPR